MLQKFSLSKMFYIVVIIMISLTSHSAKKQPILYVSFDKGINADIAKGDKFGFSNLRDFAKNNKGGQNKLFTQSSHRKLKV